MRLPRRSWNLLPAGLMGLFGLPGHLDDGRWWMGQMPMLEEFQWDNYLLVALGTIIFAYAVAPQRLLLWACRQLRSALRPDELVQPMEKIFTARMAGEIFSAVTAKNMTSVEVENYARLHIGKWIRIQNVVRDISQNEDYFFVMLGKLFEPMPFLIFSKAKWEGHIETMKQGDRIATEGRIIKIGRMDMELDCCEIVDLREEDDVLRHPSTRSPD